MTHFHKRIMKELDDIIAKNREGQIKHILLSYQLFTPIKPKKTAEPETIFYSAKSNITEYFTPNSS